MPQVMGRNCASYKYLEFKCKDECRNKPILKLDGWIFQM